MSQKGIIPTRNPDLGKKKSPFHSTKSISVLPAQPAHTTDMAIMANSLCTLIC